MDFYEDLKNKFINILENNNLINDDKINIQTKSLSPEEAIGKTKRQDFPILNGKEIMIEADYKGHKGQAFTSYPCNFKGSLKDIINLDLNDDYNKGIFISTLNAVLSYLELVSGNIHCKNDEPEKCGKAFREFLEENYLNKNIALIGFQPAILENIKDVVNLRVLDLDSKNVNTEKYGILIEDGIEKYQDVVDWADLILCTGSTVLNGSIRNFINLDKPVIFYGTSISGAAYLMSLDRKCFFPSN